ncbi:acetyl-CoA carboxylase biotin carboxylase subunit [Variovorax dokdonensis]|uniref:Acetyl-CoA carboxylase biotin carboxylase subunit n=1 Tax=Variovorax dokdonensis TaxID=344883 RepID=A0ABT7NEI2_9BURK|nr:acetyl-CoA carboxylase biotin carboxylase subunit [Variovorax dokdonensis]MDM0046347.1 acetyl-CoA carboxylase biotin carboxylase subunit [Variovorax dokdonensis]
MTASSHRETPFRKILIANRGEIALRIMRSARSLGYRTVAVYSTADAKAQHVREANQAVCIGDAMPSQSYLRIESIIDAARLSGADAVHPGYGFLAENEHFAQACEDAGLVFIGPSSQAIASMGNKAGAKALMQAAGVPCMAGYQGEDQSQERLALEAARIGFPVMIKATAGGGGRGMRLVSSANEFGELLSSARSEAQSAFGNPEVILERAIVRPRHIEIQVFADRHGNVIHLGERDCSVQRRHQKLIEEAPSPAVDADLRERMGSTAVAAVKAIGYEGAGTLEFLLDGQGNFFFMEMNTRLQVEHPVTEAISGLDLVELQLRVAAGEALPLTQQDVRFSGHAIEVRLCAEDADQGFLPQSGTLALWQMPTQLRVEDAQASGAAIAPYYDSMIAKIIGHGPTREEARRKLIAGLEDAVALGVKTNLAFLRRCLLHPEFESGGATTAFIADHLGELLAPDSEALERAAALAAVLLCVDLVEDRPRAPAIHLSRRLPMSPRFKLDGQLHSAEVIAQGSSLFEVRFQDRRLNVELVAMEPNAVRFVCDDLMEHAAYCVDGAALYIHYRALALRVDDQTRAASARQGDAGGDGKLRASMTGRVVSVVASQGQLVEAGQPIITLEAMKMEHVHSAPLGGRVIAVHVAGGEQVVAGQVIAEIETKP